MPTTLHNPEHPATVNPSRPTHRVVKQGVPHTPSLSAVARAVEAVTAARRAHYLWETPVAAAALDVSPNKFGDWWSRTERKLVALATQDPAATAAHFAMILAKAAEARRGESTDTPHKE